MQVGIPHLLVPNGKFALSFLIVLGEGLQFLNCLILQDCGKELHVLFRVLVAGLFTIQQCDHMNYSTRETHVDFGVVG